VHERLLLLLHQHLLLLPLLLQQLMFIGLLLQCVWCAPQAWLAAAWL
jgi:hypothetical protein